MLLSAEGVGTSEIVCVTSMSRIPPPDDAVTERVVARAVRTLHLPLHTNFFIIDAVEGFFAKLTNRRLKRGVFHSILARQAAINRFVKGANQNPKLFCWIKDPDEIIAAVCRGHQALRKAGCVTGMVYSGI